MSRTWFGRRDRTEADTPGQVLGQGTGTVMAPPEEEPVVTIDALGRKCPIPIIMLAEQIRDVPVGAVIAVLADDPAAYTDVPAWCGMKSHELVFRSELDSGWSFGIRRRY
jgi:tRNA 2-thiouridine synthesizing protein A